MLVSKKNGVLKDMWDAIRKDDRPHWEVMADDGMNKFLKFCIFCVFAYGFVVVAIELFDRFFWVMEVKVIDVMGTDLTVVNALVFHLKKNISNSIMKKMKS